MLSSAIPRVVRLRTIFVVGTSARMTEQIKLGFVWMPSIMNASEYSPIAAASL